MRRCGPAHPTVGIWASRKHGSHVAADVARARLYVNQDSFWHRFANEARKHLRERIAGSGVEREQSSKVPKQHGKHGFSILWSCSESLPGLRHCMDPCTVCSTVTVCEVGPHQHDEGGEKKRLLFCQCPPATLKSYCFILCVLLRIHTK